MFEIMGKVPPEERTPYVVVAFQECERMNGLTAEIRRSMKELDLGLKVLYDLYFIYFQEIIAETCFCIPHNHRLLQRNLI